jgi:hypothetical protein
VESYRAGIFNQALLHSLRTIEVAKTQFHRLTASDSTLAVLASQIEICDVLLEELRAISCSLERRMSSRDVIRPRAVVARRSRSSRYVAAPQGNQATRSKRRK